MPPRVASAPTDTFIRDMVREDLAARAANSQAQKRCKIVADIQAEYAAVLESVDPDWRPSSPTPEDFMLSKRSWESRMATWRRSLRALATETGHEPFADPLLLLTHDLNEALHIEELHRNSAINTVLMGESSNDKCLGSSDTSDDESDADQQQSSVPVPTSGTYFCWYSATKARMCFMYFAGTNGTKRTHFATPLL